MKNVALIKCEEYAEEEVMQAVRKSIDLLGGIKTFISHGQKVLLKPNMLTASAPERAVCTHPAVLKAALILVKEAGGIPYVGDSPAIGNTHKVAAKNGLAKVCQEMQVPLVNFDNPTEVQYPEGFICKRFVLDKAVLDADVIINLPKLKTHGLTFLTCGVKNLYGCISGKQKAEFHLRMPSHDDFSSMLIDLYRVVKPNLTIVDGIVGMEGAGPSNGKPRKIGVILASSSAVALDAIATQIIGLRPENIPTTQIALSKNIDISSVNEIETVGEKLEQFIIKDFAQSSAFASLKSIPRPVLNFFQNRLTAKPVINSEQCRGCGICKESCPPQVIEISNKKAAISYDKCIRCYCCQELCPHNAVKLKHGLLGKYFFKH